MLILQPSAVSASISVQTKVAMIILYLLAIDISLCSCICISTNGISTLAAKILAIRFTFDNFIFDFFSSQIVLCSFSMKLWNRKEEKNICDSEQHLN